MFPLLALMELLVLLEMYLGKYSPVTSPSSGNPATTAILSGGIDVFSGSVNISVVIPSCGFPSALTFSGLI